MTPDHSQSAQEVLPLSDPDRIVALWLNRWSDDPRDPLQIALDHALLDQLGYRPGDRITFEPVALDRRTREGGLVVRRAARNEPAIKLRRDHYVRRPHPLADYFPGRSLPEGTRSDPDGPNVAWPCPVEWVETFFPMEYIPGPGAPVFIEPDRQWLLRDLQDQRERVVVPLGCSYLEFRLQRTDPAAAKLDLHLPPGVLHLMGWSPSTSLALASATGFDPSAPADLLTIQEVSPCEANLIWDGAKFLATPSSPWLERYFPGRHNNSEEVCSGDSSAIDPADTPEDDDLIPFPGQQLPEREITFEDEPRDTFCVHFRNFKLGQGRLSFSIPETSHVWD